MPVPLEKERKHLSRVSNIQIDKETKKDKPWTKALSRREQRKLWNRNAHSVRANRLPLRRIYAAIALTSLALNLWVMTVTLPGYSAKVARVDVLEKKALIADSTILRQSKAITYLETDVDRQLKKIKAKYNKAVKDYENAEEEFNKIIANMGK